MKINDEEIIQWTGRYLILIVNSLIGFAGFYTQALPSALQVDLQGRYTRNCSDLPQNTTCCTHCLGLGPDKYNQLGAMSLWMSSACSIPGGVLADRLGNRVASIFFTTFSMIGATTFALGTSTWFCHTSFMFPLMLTGRFFIGIGVTAVKIVMDRVVSFWFSDRIEFAWGVTISMARLGTVMNFIGTAYIAEKYGLDVACWVGALLGLLTFLLAIVLVCLDVYGARKSNVYQRHDTESKKLSFGRIKEFTLQFWCLTLILAAFYANFNPFVANGSQWMSDKYGIHKTTASYIVGISSDVAVVFSPIFGGLLTKFGGRSFAVFLGSALILPVYVLVLFTRVSPIIINTVMGFNYVLIVVSLWPAISKSVSVDLVGTALGITSLFTGILAGLSMLAVGKLLDFLNKGKAPYTMSSWTMVMGIFMGISGISLLASIPALLRDLNKVCKRGGTDIKNLKRDVSENDPLLN